MLLIGIGIFVSIFVVTIAGGAVPIDSYTLNPNFINGSPPAYSISFDSNVNPPLTLVNDFSPTLHEPAVINTTEWHTGPIKAGFWIAAASVVFITILYLLLRRVHYCMSEEIFP
jgi:hypothetical protein